MNMGLKRVALRSPLIAVCSKLTGGELQMERQNGALKSLTFHLKISSSHGSEYEVQNCLLGCTAACTSETSINNYFTWQYIPEDNSELKECRLKSHTGREEFLTFYGTVYYCAPKNLPVGTMLSQMTPHHTPFHIRSILIFYFSHGLFSAGFVTKKLYTFLISPICATLWHNWTSQILKETFLS
jgi:hypothetical protein